MAKRMVYFNATKQIETITIHYNSKLDGSFVDDICNYIKEIAKKMTKINLKEPRDYYAIKVYVYPSVKMFNEIFNGVIEKRYYNRKRSLEDFYIVQDEEGNIHVASPRGKSQQNIEALKKIVVMKILGEYMNEKDKQIADKMLRASMMKNKELEEQEEEELEEEPAEEEAEEVEELEEEETEIDEEEIDEMVELEEELAEIDETESEKLAEEETENEAEEQEGEIPKKVLEARQWLSVGWMDYLNGKLSTEKQVKYFTDHISKKGVKKLGKLKDSSWYENYNYSREFAIAIVEYIIVTYGKNKFLQFYESPTDYKHVFGTTKFCFEQEVKAYIYTKYGPSRMKEEIKERGVEEVMRISLDNSGGASITTVGEDDEERMVETEFILSLDDEM